MLNRYEGYAWNDRFLPRLTTNQIKELPKEDALVILPIGAVEQHGTHLPVYTDTLLAETVLTETFQYLPEHLNIWLLPALPYSKSNEHAMWSGTISLSFTTLQGIIMDIAKSIKQSGFKRLIIFNTHGGNNDLLKMMMREIRLETGMSVFYIFIGALPIDTALFNDVEIKYGIHGGALETSMVMASRPDWVRTEYVSKDISEQIVHSKYLKYQQGNFAWTIDDISTNGICGDARDASAEKGRIIYQQHSKLIAEILLEMAEFEFYHINKEGVQP
ncbi:creatininase family protein [Cytobacillus dafuensis]|uniref:Creatininase family protein n=1 Tax=Cytobacillus dafuensis TaxID=1742359 RepID=A0A5B8Z2E3_CYTDA|nr:creatininase family protein [Cytobacillus dafuensis]QED47041.1 creatininase family protein [Cytobacillus dafuensis]